MRPCPRALVVDADPVIRLAVDRQLDSIGWEAITVNTGREAVRVVELHLFIDVLLSELKLPDLEGVTVAWLVTRHSPATRVAFMAESPPEEPLEPRQAPLLIKPFSTQALVAALSGAAIIRHLRRV